MRVANGVRLVRVSQGLSQAQLAARAGVTRQVISAIEGGDYAPTTGIALKLAQALGRRVEDLFWLHDDVQRLEARLALAPDIPAGAAQPLRVRLARRGDEILAVPLTGQAMNETADGIIDQARPGGSNVVRMLAQPAMLDNTLFAYGCDPALAVLGGHLQRRFAGYRLAWVSCGSTASLQALARGDAHIAGTHLHPVDEADTLAAIRQNLGDMPVLVVTFAIWEEGLILARGNPKGIQSVHDLQRAGVTLANREPGSGARALLDRALAEAGIDGAQVSGYSTIARSHQAVAEVVAAGAADAGIGIRAVAQGYGLDFICMQRQRYDLVIAQVYVEQAPVQALLEQLSRPALRHDVEALGGYDVSLMGQVLCEA